MQISYCIHLILFTLFLDPIRGLCHQIRNLAYYLGFDFKETRYENPDDWFMKDKKN